MIKALMVRPGEHPSITLLIDDGKFLDCAVSTDTDFPLTATALEVESGIIALHSEEGVLLGLPPNRQINTKIIAGTFYIAGHHKGKLRSLTDKEITRFTLGFWEPEIHSVDDILDSWYP